MNWALVISKWVVAFAFGSFATYAGKQASNYYNSEEFNRKMELELATLNPYLEGLDDQKVKEIKTELINVFFGNNVAHSSNDLNKKNQNEPFRNCNAATIDKN